MVLYFVTGNERKAQEVAEILGYEVQRLNVDLPEIQSSDPREIIKHKLMLARGILSEKPDASVIVEDTSLYFNAWCDKEGSGLPGPLFKFFLGDTKKDPNAYMRGLERMVKMLSPFEDKSARAVTLFGYAPPSVEPLLFEGAVEGRIVPPHGERRFGWDPIFVQNGYTQTYAEMDPRVKNQISPRRLALDKLRDHLRK